MCAACGGLCSGFKKPQILNSLLMHILRRNRRQRRRRRRLRERRPRRRRRKRRRRRGLLRRVCDWRGSLSLHELQAVRDDLQTFWKFQRFPPSKRPKTHTQQQKHPNVGTGVPTPAIRQTSRLDTLALGGPRTPSNALERPRTPSNGPSRALECPRIALEPHFGQILKIWKLCWFCETKPCLHVFGHKLSRCRQNVWTLVGLSRNHSFIHCCGLCGLPGFHRDHLVWFGCKMREI